MLVNKGGGASLDEIAAHDSHSIIGSRQAPGFFQMVFMSVVKGVIFRNDSVYIHDFSPACMIINIPYKNME